MRLASLTLVLVLILTGILPDTTPRRPRTVRMSRSASEPDFKKFLVADDIRREAKEKIGNLKRVVLIPLMAAGSVEAIDAFAITMNIENDLHYVTGLLPSDTTSVWTEPDAPARSPRERLPEIAKKLQAQFVITGTLNEKNQLYQLELVAYEIKNDAPSVIGKSKAEGLATELATVGDKALLSLLEQMKISLSAEARKQITLVPTSNPEAMRECASAFQLLVRAMSSASKQERTPEEINIRAREHARRAVAADSEFALAYLMKASAHENCDEPEDMKTTLADAKATLNRADQLTRLELQGDYERLVNGKKGREKAIAYYEEMLKIDPGHLRALLSLVECFAADDGGHNRNDLKEAAKYAARITAAHPGSPITKLFE